MTTRERTYAPGACEEAARRPCVRDRSLRPRFLWLLLLVVGSPPVPSVARGGEEAAQLAEVKTLDELKAVEPVRLRSGWDVRLGWRGDGGEAAGPWLLVYCHATYAGDEKEPTIDLAAGPGQALGPVRFTAEWEDGGGDENDESPAPADERPRAAREPARAPTENLYCGVVPAAWKGTCRLRVVTPDGKLLGARIVTLKQPRPCDWHVFADRGLDLGDAPFACRRAAAAYPASAGSAPQIPKDGPRGKLQDAALPGTVPPAPEWLTIWSDGAARPLRANDGGLELSLEGNRFVVKSQGPSLVDAAEQFLLARWWVNGEPVAAPMAAEHPRRQQGRLYQSTDRMAVDFGYPDSLGALTPGDKIGLQVLYAPAGYEEVPPTPVPALAAAAVPAYLDVARVPLLSNRFEFVLTDGLLAAREKPPAAPGG